MDVLLIGVRGNDKSVQMCIRDRFCPNTSTSPEVIGVRPKIIFIIVVLPAPLRPKSP